VSSLYIAISFGARPARLPESNDEHRRIVQASRRRDAEEAAALVREHVLGTLRLAEGALAERELVQQPVGQTGP
jgi:DNA-binding GntR family transcriptional regulator